VHSEGIRVSKSERSACTENLCEIPLPPCRPCPSRRLQCPSLLTTPPPAPEPASPHDLVWTGIGPCESSCDDCSDDTVARFFTVLLIQCSRYCPAYSAYIPVSRRLFRSVLFARVTWLGISCLEHSPIFIHSISHLGISATPEFLRENELVTCAAFDKYYKGLSKAEIKVPPATVSSTPAQVFRSLPRLELS
jgi:hypothetical protein